MPTLGNKTDFFSVGNLGFNIFYNIFAASRKVIFIKKKEKTNQNEKVFNSHS